MAEFVVNQPVVQPEPLVRVDVTPNAPLPLGVNRFRLIVVDDSGNESEAAFLEVIVRDADRPTAVLDMVNADGRRIDPVVGFGASFLLSGERSADTGGGRVTEYRFTLVDR